jgi:hypothetical protein
MHTRSRAAGGYVRGVNGVGGGYLAKVRGVYLANPYNVRELEDMGILALSVILCLYCLYGKDDQDRRQGSHRDPCHQERKGIQERTYQEGRHYGKEGRRTHSQDGKGS